MKFYLKGTDGGGKTDVLLMDFAKNVGIGWGASWKGILFRENFPDLQDVISKSLKWFSQIFPDARYNRSNHMWQFATGEQLFFRHARVPDDYWNFHGHEYPWIGWEELTNWATPDLYLMMMSCNRCSDPRVKKRIISTCNPWGKGHNWVKSRFIDKAKPCQIIKEIIPAEELQALGVPNAQDMINKRVYIHADRNENKALVEADPNYVINIAQNGNPVVREAWLNGNWDIMAGGMFDDLWKPSVHVLKGFTIPWTWRVYRCFDWGFTKPFAYLLYAVSDGSDYITNEGQRKSAPRGSVFFIGEYYGWNGSPNEGARMTNAQIGRNMKKIDEEYKLKYKFQKILKGPADSAIFAEANSNGSGITQIDDITQGYYGVKSTNYIFKESNKSPRNKNCRVAVVKK